MPTIISHPAVPLAITCAAGINKISPRLLVAGIVASMLPDADVIGFHFGVPYAHIFGHRGFFHSPMFALLSSLIAALMWRKLCATYKSAFFFLFLSMLSHGVLDAATSGGLGIAFLSPFSNHRYFFPWQPIYVSPIGVGRFFSSRGLMVIRSELLWVWAPCFVLGLLGLFFHRYIAAPNTYKASRCQE